MSDFLPRRSGGLGGLLGSWARLLLFYALAVVLGGVALVGLFKSGLLAAISILFYRGVILVAVGGVVTFILLALLTRGLGRSFTARDAFAAAVLSASINLSFLVVFPVTIDRSQTLFILGEMSNTPQRSFAPREVRDFFVGTYVDDYRQMDRRLQEQTVSGNIEKTADGYRITPQGQAVIAMSGRIAALFDIDPRFIKPPALPAKGLASPSPAPIKN